MPGGSPYSRNVPVSSVVCRAAHRHQLALAVDRPVAHRHHRHAGHDVAEVVQHPSGDHAGGRERQHHAVERLAVGQLERPARAAGPPRAQRAVDVARLRAVQLVTSRRQAVERERAVAVAQGHPRLAAAERVQHDARPPQRQPGVAGHDAAAHDAGADRGGRARAPTYRAAARRASRDVPDVGADGAGGRGGLRVREQGSADHRGTGYEADGRNDGE